MSRSRTLSKHPQESNPEVIKEHSEKDPSHEEERKNAAAENAEEETKGEEKEMDIEFSTIFLLSMNQFLRRRKREFRKNSGSTGREGETGKKKRENRKKRR